MKKVYKTLIAFSLLLVLSIFCLNNCHAQTNTTSTCTYNGNVYDLHTGSRGGKFIILEDHTKHYIASETSGIKVVGSEAIYHGVKYPIQTGSRGGKYIIVGNTKSYIKWSA